MNIIIGWEPLVKNQFKIFLSYLFGFGLQVVMLMSFSLILASEITLGSDQETTWNAGFC